MPLPSVLSRPRKTINGFNSDWNAGGGDLPIQYVIDNTKWPINTEDDTNSFSSVVDNSGFAEIVLAGPTYESYQTDDWVKITGSVYSGNFRIRESLSANRFIIDTSFVSTDTGTAQLYYNNYTTLIQVYAGIFYDHPLYYSDAIELIGTIELRPDSNNETLVDIHKYVKRHLESKNDIDQSDWPNDINAWTDFYISFAERYDDAGVQTTSVYTDDSLTFIGHAVNGALQLANLYGGNYYEYVADVNASGAAKWLSFFTNAYFSNRRYIDFSILSNDGEFDVDIVQYDINGTELKTDTLSYTGKGRGVYRISPIGLVFEDATAYFTLQAFSGYTALSETQKVLLEDTCIEPTDPPLAADPITATDGLSAISIDWTVNQPDADQQLLFRSTSASGPFSQIASLGVTVNTYSDSDVVLGNTYYYYVQTWKGGLFVNSAIVSAQLLNAFQITVKTDNPGTSANNQFTFPLEAAGNYNFDVYYNGAIIKSITVYTDDTITFADGTGTKEIALVGTIEVFRFNLSEDYRKILDVKRWGAFVQSGASRAFYGCSNLNITATDTPTLSGAINEFFRSATSLVGTSAIGDWDTSAVTDMDRFFTSCALFNIDISGWDTGLVTDMSFMLFGCSIFDHNLGTWDIGSLTTFSRMFDGAGMSTANYTDTLVGWANYAFNNGGSPINVNGSTQTGMTYDTSRSGGANFADAGAARTYLTSTLGWTISGDTVI